MSQSFNTYEPPMSNAGQAAIVLDRLNRQVRNGASNFFWIAGLSAVNTVLAFVGSDTRFVIGLGATQFVDAVAYYGAQRNSSIQTILMVVAFVIDLFFIGLFVLLGYLSTKKKLWAFIIGIALYSFDALLMLAFQDWLGLGFHVFFLFGLLSGVRALNQLQKLAKPQVLSDFPQNIGS